ncbi:hypothetical protein L6452_34239 [Arctium lappa]|uniref:Uncharacterized protein n=1 Tax=Arctium lappa TaxID=4217 RepID=A0ACB8YIN0_ARCLA|nr:hypothetical protein L6452_34239 [Arctium lappa]
MRFRWVLGSIVGELRSRSCRIYDGRDEGRLDNLPAVLDQLQRYQKAQDGCCLWIGFGMIGAGFWFLNWPIRLSCTALDVVFAHYDLDQQKRSAKSMEKSNGYA